MGKGYELIPVDHIPERNSNYKNAVIAFSKGDAKECLVKIEGVQPKSIRLGLRKAIAALQIDIKDVMRGDEVYLTKDW